MSQKRYPPDENDLDLPASGGGAPAAHATSHQNGGSDEINVAGLSGVLADPQTPAAHASSHQPGGGDAMAVDAAAATGSLRTLGASATQACAGDDARLSNARVPLPHVSEHELGGTDQLDVSGLSGVLASPQTPAAHASSHQPGGGDAMAVDAAAATGSLRTLGSGATQACAGNDSRLSDARTPTAHATSHQPGGGDAMAVDAAAATGSLRTLGTGATQACAGNDSRLSNARTPTGTASGDLGGTYPSPTVIRASGAFAYTGIITPTALAANTNNWAPTGHATASFWRVSASVAVDLTGIAGGATGREITLANVGSFAITLTRESGSSTAANRIAQPALAGFVLSPDHLVVLRYDATSSRWRIKSGTRIPYGNGVDTVCQGNDARLSDSRTPTAHATSHQPGGGDAMAVDAAAATGSLRTLGTSSTQACAGNDARLSDARTPIAHASDHQEGGSDEIAVDENTFGGGDIPKTHPSTGFLHDSWYDFGSGSGQVCAGDDSRLSDSRAPNGSAGGDLAGTYPNPTVAKATNSFALAGILSPTALSANANDWNPTSLANASIIRVDQTGVFSITGIQGGAPGRVLTLWNVSAHLLLIQNESGSSTAANRIVMEVPFHAVQPGGVFELKYDSTSSRWRAYAFGSGSPQAYGVPRDITGLGKIAPGWIDMESGIDTLSGGEVTVASSLAVFGSCTIMFGWAAPTSGRILWVDYTEINDGSDFTIRGEDDIDVWWAVFKTA